MPVKNNAMPDVITQIYPWKTLTVASWKMGQIPLWNPYSFSGTTHAGNYQTAVFSPVNILFFLLGSIDGWSIAVLAQPFLAGIFMYMLMRTLKTTKAAALLGAVGYMFSGFLVVWMAYETLGYAVLYLPLILAGIIHFHERASIAAIVSIAGGIALSLLSGHFQMSIYVVSISLVFSVYWGIVQKKKQKILTTVLFILLGILICAPQLIASFDAYAQSVRSASFVKGEIIPWQYLITVFSPDYYGNPVTRNDWFGHYAEWASFIGVIPLIFSLYAVYRRRSSTVWFFLIVGVTALLLATPTIVSDLLFALRIPVLSTSAAGRVIMLFSFSLCVLSAFGFDMLRRDWRDKNHKPFFLFTLVIALFVLLLWGMLFSGALLPDDKLAIAKRNSILPSLIAGLWVMCAGIGFLNIKRLRIFIVAFLVLIAMGDSMRFASKWMPFDSRAYMYPDLDVIHFLTQNTGMYRVFGNFGNELGGQFGIPSIEGYDAVYQKRYGEFIRFADEGTLKNPERSVVTLARGGQYSQRALDLLGVKYILHRLSDGTNVWAYPYWKYPFYTSVYKDDHYEILENAHTLPRYYLASSYLVMTDPDEMLSYLYTTGPVETEHIILEKEPPLPPKAGKGTVQLSRFTPNEIVFSVESQTDTLLYLSDVYESGWKARIDGKQAPVLRANYAFRAMAVPAGSHTVRMYYQPRSVTIGMPVTVLSLLILMGVAWRIRYENRHLRSLS